MKRWLEKYFGFNQNELRGLCFSILIIGILYISPMIYAYLFPIRIQEISEKNKQEIQAFLAHVRTDSYQPKSTPQEKKQIEYFEFNPNELSTQNGTLLGLSPPQIRMIQNYINKGGHFYKKEDFQKIYAITKEDYERLAPYIKIPRQIKKQPSLENRVAKTASFPKREWTKKPTTKLHIELNSTDSIALQELYGIGPVFASRIIRYRDRLGGFHDVSQLMEVYGMDEERYEPLSDQIFVDVSLLKKIDINDADFKLLNNHPFINYKQANAIIQYRKQHGDFEKVEDLLNVLIIDEDFLRKIAPYLSCS